MSGALSVALAALLFLEVGQTPPPDPAGDAPPPLDAPAVQPEVADPVPREDPGVPRTDAGEQERTPVRPSTEEPATPAPDARPAETASGLIIGTSAALGGLIMGALPAAACGCIPLLGIPVACFGAAVGVGAGGVVGTVLAGGDLDDNVLLLGGAAGVAGGVAFLGASAASLVTLMLYGNNGASTPAFVLGSAISFGAAALGSVAAAVLVAWFPPALRAPPASTTRPRRAPPASDAEPEGDVLDAVHHPAIRY